MRRATTGVAAWLLVATWIRPARADGAPPRTASLSWVRPANADGCVATRALARAVDERLGRRVIVSAAEADLSVEGSVEAVADPPGWRAVVSLRDADGRSLGSREISAAGRDCEALSAPLAIVIAVLIDPEATRATTKPAVPLAKPPTAGSPPPAPPCSPPAREPWGASAWGGAVTGVGLLPTLGLGAIVGARLTPPRFWGVELYGVWWAPQRRPVESGAAVSFALAYGGVGLCPLALGGAGASLTGCLGARLGSLRATPTGFDRQLAHEQLVADLTASARLSVPVARPFVILVGLSLAAGLRRDDVRYAQPSRDEISVFRQAPVSATGDFALGVRFP